MKFIIVLYIFLLRRIWIVLCIFFFLNFISLHDLHFYKIMFHSFYSSVIFLLFMIHNSLSYYFLVYSYWNLPSSFFLLSSFLIVSFFNYIYPCLIFLFSIMLVYLPACLLWVPHSFLHSFLPSLPSLHPSLFSFWLPFYRHILPKGKHILVTTHLYFY